MEQNRINLVGRTIFLSLFLLFVLSFSNKSLNAENTSRHVTLTEFYSNNSKEAIVDDLSQTYQIHFNYTVLSAKAISFSSDFKEKINSDNFQSNLSFKCQETNMKLIKPLINSQFLTRNLFRTPDEIPILG